MGSRYSLIVRRSSGDGKELSSEASEEVVFVHALERSLLLLLVKPSGAEWALARRTQRTRPGIVVRYLGQRREIAVYQIYIWFENAVCEEELNVQFARNDAAGLAGGKSASLLKQLGQGVRSLVSRATVLMSAEMQSTHLQVAGEPDVIVGKQVCAYGRKRYR